MTELSPNANNGIAALSLRLGTVFTPSAPVNQTELFAGRLQELQEIADATNQRGTHAVLFGERGVGKTSLATVLPQFLQLAGITGLVASVVNCESSDNFASLWRKALRELQVSTQLPLAGLTPQNRTVTSTLDSALGTEPNGEDIRYLLQRTGGKLLLVMDEFDRISDEETSRMMADTIKTLSDHSVDVTIVLVGVADTVDQLLKEHLSIDRCLVQVHMPRMSVEELADILSKALSQVGMDIEDSAADFITYLSEGLPHYTHLLGIASARSALEAGRMTIESDDVANAIQSAVHQAQRSIMVSYDSATSSPRKESLYEQVLVSCALAPVDELGYFGARDVREPMSKIMGRRYDISAFARHLDAFCSEDRGTALEKIGARRRFRYRFRNPLLQPYVIMRGIFQGLITPELLDGLRSHDN